MQRNYLHLQACNQCTIIAGPLNTNYYGIWIRAAMCLCPQAAYTVLNSLRLSTTVGCGCVFLLPWPRK